MLQPSIPPLCSAEEGVLADMMSEIYFYKGTVQGFQRGVVKIGWCGDIKVVDLRIVSITNSNIMHFSCLHSDQWTPEAGS
jgi:hypothetical protein